MPTHTQLALEACDILDEIGHLYTLVGCGDINQLQFYSRLEQALRGPPPEGHIRSMTIRNQLEE